MNPSSTRELRIEDLRLERESVRGENDAPILSSLFDALLWGKDGSKAVSIDGSRLRFQITGNDSSKRAAIERELIALFGKHVKLVHNSPVGTDVAIDAPGIQSVSVVVPTFNRSLSKISGCLSSISKAARSSGTQVEIILVDDCSAQPLSEAELENLDLQNVDLKVIRLPSNRGPSFSRGSGLKAAKNDLVFLVDDDDEIHPLTFSLFSAILSSEDAVASYGMKYPDGRVFSPLLPEVRTLVRTNTNGSNLVVRKNHPSILSLIESESFFSGDRFRHYEDWELNGFLTAIGIPIKPVPIPLYLYRMEKTGRDSREKSERFYSQTKAIRSFFRRAAQFKKSLGTRSALLPEEFYLDAIDGLCDQLDENHRRFQPIRRIYHRVRFWK